MKPIRWAILFAIAAVASGIGACAPSPQAYVAEPLTGTLRVAILPFANYTGSRDAPDRIGPMVAVELAQRKNVEVVDAGLVEVALENEPWLLIDRLPPDIVDSLAAGTGASAVLVGAVLAYGERQESEGPVPEVSLSLRLLQAPGGRVLWSTVYSRDGTDSESVFGFGRIQSLERLAADVVHDIMKTFPEARQDRRPRGSVKVGT